MGGKPLTALNLIMFPAKKLDPSILKEILRGGYDKVSEAGASIAGGHSADDNEPKYGLAVTGVIHPERILTNCGAREGDVLILTKPLGTGVLFNACRSKKLPWRDLEVILPEAASLNKKAIEIALNFEIHACTDITGFGIIGHSLEMAKGSGVQINLFYDKLPFYPNAADMYRRGETTGTNKANRKLLSITMGNLVLKQDTEKPRRTSLKRAFLPQVLTLRELPFFWRGIELFLSVKPNLFTLIFFYRQLQSMGG